MTITKCLVCGKVLMDGEQNLEPHIFDRGSKVEETPDKTIVWAYCEYCWNSSNMPTDMNKNLTERRCPNPRPRPRPRPKIIPLGTVVKPWGKIVAIGFISGERYYWFVEINDPNCVAMIPGFMVESEEQ